MNFDSSTFDPSKLSFDASKYKSVSFHNHHRLFDLLLGYVASHLIDDNGSGYRMDVAKTNADDDNPLGNSHFGRILVKIGFGEFKFRTFQGDELYAVYQHLGKPVGGDCGPDIMQNIIVFTPSLQTLGLFLSELVEIAEKPEDGKFVCFTWMIRHQFWREEVRVNNRPMQSVVLPSAMKQRLLNDVEKFLSPKTKDFYFRNGIPYRRSYLFHGAPGTGKTSMVQAIAGHFQRNVCFLLPTHPEMTDDSLRDAIQSIPGNSIVVFEDIDALFTKNRENKSNKSALTFSGLLNALDGIGAPNGQIFVLTTNLRDNLDHALIRNGRVDLHIEFTFAVAEQMKQMWENFYPDATHLSDDFAAAVETALVAKGLQITTSALQHFFITQMEATAEEALTAVPSIVEEVLQNSSSSMLEAAKREGKKKNKNKKNKNKADGGEQKESEDEGEVREDLEVVGTAIKASTSNTNKNDANNNNNNTTNNTNNNNNNTNSNSGNGDASGGEGGKKKKKNKNKNKKNKNKNNNNGEGEEKEDDKGEVREDLEGVVGTSIKIPNSNEEKVEGGDKKKNDKKNKNKNKKENKDRKENADNSKEGTTAETKTETEKKESTPQKAANPRPPIQTEVVYEKKSNNKNNNNNNNEKKKEEKKGEKEDIAAAVKEEVKKAVETSAAPASPVKETTTATTTTTATATTVHETTAAESPLPPRKDRKQRNNKSRSNSDGSGGNSANKGTTGTTDNTTTTADPAPAPAPETTTDATSEGTQK